MSEVSGDIYVVSIGELVWGSLLVLLTMLIHGLGVLMTLRAGEALQRRAAGSGRFRHAIRPLIVATWLLVFVHTFEVLVWALFYSLKGAFANLGIAYYYALMQFTTVGSNLHLPTGLHLLGGMNAMAGLLTFAWTTGVLVTLAHRFETEALRRADDHSE